MKGFNNHITWHIDRKKELDIKGDSGKCYIFRAFNGKRHFRESIVRRYSKYYKRVMYDNSYDSFMCSSQKEMASHLCEVFSYKVEE
jgi:hypothetical protein